MHAQNKSHVPQNNHCAVLHRDCILCYCNEMNDYQVSKNFPTCFHIFIISKGTAEVSGWQWNIDTILVHFHFVHCISDKKSINNSSQLARIPITSIACTGLAWRQWLCYAEHVHIIWCYGMLQQIIFICSWLLKFVQAPGKRMKCLHLLCCAGMKNCSYRLMSFSFLITRNVMCWTMKTIFLNGTIC